MDAHQFFVELKDRGVYRIAALYSAGSWALLQAVDLLFPLMGIPDWGMTVVMVTVALGFPLAIALAWVFDVTADGVTVTPEPQPFAKRRTLSLIQMIEIVLIVALIIFVSFLYMERLALQTRNLAAGTDVGIGATGISTTPSIAVIPFVNMSDDADIEYFGDGLAEEILNLLTKLNELNVAARTSSFSYKNGDVDIPTIGKQLGVLHVLEGSVRYEDDRIRVTAQLIDASNGFHIWSDTWNREFKDIFSIQDEIARQVVSNLKLILSPESQRALERRAAVDPVAYDYYLQGRDYLRRVANLSNLDEAAALFQKAIDLDPEYAAAYAGLCDAFLAQYTENREVRGFESAEKACHRALTLDSEAIPVYIALGNLYRNAGQLNMAKREYRRAISLNSRSVDAHNGLALTHVAADRPRLAEQTFEKAIQLQPTNWRGYNSMGNYLFAEGRVEDAIPFYQRITELTPGNERAFNNLGAAYYMAGSFAKAMEAWQQSLQLHPTATTYSNVGSSLFFLERFEEAALMYQKAAELTPEDYEVWGNLADAYKYSSDNVEFAGPMYERAIELAREHLKINASDPLYLSFLGYYYASAGNRELGMTYLSKASDLAPRHIVVYYHIAVARCALGDLDQAARALDMALELGYPWKLARVDAGLKKIREMPRFEAFSRRADRQTGTPN